MKAHNVAPDVLAYNTVIDVALIRSKWEDAINLLAKMVESGVHPNANTYLGVLTACEKSGKWEKALEVLNLMEAKYYITTPAFKSAMNACANANQHEQVFAVFDRATAKGIPPDAGMYAALIRSCGRATDPARATAALETMVASKVTPKVATFCQLAETYGACGRHELIRPWLERAVEEGWVRLWAKIPGGSLGVNLRDFSPALAEIAVQFVADSIKSGASPIDGKPLSEGIRFILRNNAARHSHDVHRVAQTVVATLAALPRPLQAKEDKLHGRVEVGQVALAAWLQPQATP